MVEVCLLFIHTTEKHSHMMRCVHNDLDYDILCQSQVHPAKMVLLNMCSTLAVL